MVFVLAIIANIGNNYSQGYMDFYLTSGISDAEMIPN
jgi:hypothetical protein